MLLRKFSLLSCGFLMLSSSLFSYQISETKKVLYFGVPKVATNTIVDILKSPAYHPILKTYRRDYANYDSSEYPGYFKFAFVRNPWARVVSCYFNKVVSQKYPPFARCRDKGFEYFVKFIEEKDLTKADIHIRLQTKLVPLDELDFLGHLETFNEDMMDLFSILGLEPPAIPHANSTSHKHYSSYYTPETRDIVARIYKDDIEAFGYVFEEIPSEH